MGPVRVSLLFLFLCLLLAACGDSSPTTYQYFAPVNEPTATIPPNADPKVTRGASQDEDAIKEAVLRAQFEKRDGDPADPFKAYCLGSGTTMGGITALSDPPQSLIDRFKGNNPPVVRASECTMVGDNKALMRKSVLKVSGGSARFWAVSAVTWLTGNRVELEASHQGNQGDAGGQVFQLERKDGNWLVVGFNRTWTA